MNEIYDVAIIGAGPAGMTAALYASRSGMKTCMIEAGAPGGKMLKTYLVSNYPGVAEIPGPDLGMTMYEQSLAFGAEYIAGTVSEVLPDKTVRLTDGREIRARSVIVATGTKERLLGIPGEQELVGHGVSYCAVCEGAFFRNKTVAVIGGGNAALEESGFLSQFVDKMYIIIRRDQFRAEEKLQKEVMANPKVEIIRDTVPVRVVGEDTVTGLVVKNVKTGEESQLDVAGVFPYIGQDPISGMVKDLGVCDEHGAIITNQEMMTKVPGVFAAGDVRVTELRQIVTATSDGAKAAESAFLWAKEHLVPTEELAEELEA
ncbi:thioredoxin-disulfide reductase [Faecalibaculum rodentium]|uniref:thioredoxin-disulfide reductase n=1 Tax=Faecalibaculum rodentium TaxID=1702221 RepID=UPI00255B0B3A|nr:thioredoxin-disulfide reductase [Faecalibaculum rodentium]